MNQVEIRWVVRPGWDGPVRVLQYRNQLRVTDYSSLETVDEPTTILKWNEWQDVPTVKETT